MKHCVSFGLTLNGPGTMRVSILRTVLVCLFVRNSHSVYFDNVPPNTASVNENAATATSVRKFDLVGTTPTLEITSQTPSSPVFTVVKVLFSYELQTPAGLDYESVPSFTVNIRATDASDSSTFDEAIIVTIGDVNDNSPIFAGSTSISYLASATPATQVTATDGDGTSPNNQITTYSITGGTGQSLFSIDNDGRITKTGTIAPGQDYTLDLTATDGGSPAMTGTTTLTLKACSTADLNVRLNTCLSGITSTEYLLPNLDSTQATSFCAAISTINTCVNSEVTTCSSLPEFSWLVKDGSVTLTDGYTALCAGSPFPCASSVSTASVTATMTTFNNNLGDGSGKTEDEICDELETLVTTLKALLTCDTGSDAATTWDTFFSNIQCTSISSSTRQPGLDLVTFLLCLVSSLLSVMFPEVKLKGSSLY